MLLLRNKKSGCLVASTNGNNNSEILKCLHCNWIYFSSFSALTAGMACPEDKSSRESAYLACFFVYYCNAV